MKQTQQFTAIIEREGDGYVSLCPQLDIASQGNTVEEARENLLEAMELFFEVATEAEVKDRLHGEVFVTIPVPNYSEIRIGTLQSIIRQSGLPRLLFETR